MHDGADACSGLKHSKARPRNIWPAHHLTHDLPSGPTVYFEAHSVHASGAMGQFRQPSEAHGTHCLEALSRWNPRLLPSKGPLHERQNVSLTHSLQFSGQLQSERDVMSGSLGGPLPGVERQAASGQWRGWLGACHSSNGCVTGWMNLCHGRLDHKRLQHALAALHIIWRQAAAGGDWETKLWKMCTHCSGALYSQHPAGSSCARAQLTQHSWQHPHRNCNDRQDSLLNKGSALGCTTAITSMHAHGWELAASSEAELSAALTGRICLYRGTTHTFHCQLGACEHSQGGLPGQKLHHEIMSVCTT